MYVISKEKPCISSTEASVRVADARQYLALRKAAESHCHSSGLENMIEEATISSENPPIRQEAGPTLLLVAVYHLFQISGGINSKM